MVLWLYMLDLKFKPDMKDVWCTSLLTCGQSQLPSAVVRTLTPASDIAILWTKSFDRSICMSTVLIVYLPAHSTDLEENGLSSCDQTFVSLCKRTHHLIRHTLDRSAIRSITIQQGSITLLKRLHPLVQKFLKDDICSKVFLFFF